MFSLVMSYSVQAMCSAGFPRQPALCQAMEAPPSSQPQIWGKRRTRLRAAASALPALCCGLSEAPKASEYKNPHSARKQK